MMGTVSVNDAFAQVSEPVKVTNKISVNPDGTLHASCVITGDNVDTRNNNFASGHILLEPYRDDGKLEFIQFDVDDPSSTLITFGQFGWSDYSDNLEYLEGYVFVTYCSAHDVDGNRTFEITTYPALEDLPPRPVEKELSAPVIPILESKEIINGIEQVAYYCDTTNLPADNTFKATLSHNGGQFESTADVTKYNPDGITTFIDDSIHIDLMCESFDSNDNKVSSNMIVYYAEPLEVREDIKSTTGSDGNSNGGGCTDCVAPTLGLDINFKRIVDNGFSYNGITTQVEKWHTSYPLINTTVGEMNKVEILAYENHGISNMKMVQFGLGVEYIGQPLSLVEVLVEVPLITNGTTHGIKTGELTIRDKDNLIDNDTVSATAIVVQCMDDAIDEECVKVTLHYSYREKTLNHIMVVNVSDKSRNAQNFYFNDGVKVVGQSMNPVPYYIMDNKQTNQQTEDLTIVLFRADKINHIWIDGMGIEYLKVSENRFDRITPAEPYQCNDKPLSEINVPTRNNCHFRALLS